MNEIAKYCFKAQTSTVKCQIYFGIDSGDEVLDCDAGRDLLQAPFHNLDISTLVVSCSESEGAICRIWNTLALTAYDDGCEFIVLLGDDVVVHTQNWMTEIITTFEALHQRLSSLPFGFGIVCMNDLSFPGFPTFPVVHRTHIDIMGEMFPKDFINQV